MRPRQLPRSLPIVVACAWLVCAPAIAQDLDLRSAVIAADDARVTSEADRETISRALADPDAGVRVMAVRAIGRTRRAEFMDRAIAALADPSIDVRREAAFAIAHIGTGTRDALGRATTSLLDSLAREQDPLVTAAIAEEVGRLPVENVDALDRVARALRARVPGAPPVVLGVARAAEALARRAARESMTSEPLSALLDSLFETASERTDALAVRVRRLTVTARTADRAIRDADAQVRRLAVALLALRGVPLEAALGWLADPSPLVRHAVVTKLGPWHPTVAERALSDRHINVRLAAIDLLGEQGAYRHPLPAVADGAWHEHAHALVAAARTDAAVATPLITQAASSPVWQVRMYAARAAGHARVRAVLERLVADAHANVRHAALVGWKQAQLDGLTAVATRCLDTDDGQLALEAAQALRGAATSPAVVDALRAALRRFSTDGRDTSRDPREELAARVRELDPQADATLRTIGPAIAAPRLRVPTWQDVLSLEQHQVVLRLNGQRTLTIRLYPRNAPTAVARFVSQVRAGEWNGRTFHRVEPGFVIQGGSPMANEYAGAAAYTRDEFSAMSNVRGTVGISTRGPDTGDGQIFVNLVDNHRLDFGFTIIGAVAARDTLLDDLLEGEIIEAAEVVAVAR